MTGCRGQWAHWALEPGDAAGVSRIRHQIMATLARIAAPQAPPTADPKTDRRAAGARTTEQDLDAAEVVVAELLSNALAHTGGRAWVSLRWDGPHPLLSVADGGPGFPARPELFDERLNLVPRLPDDPMAEGGRGLYLIARLALDLAIATRPTGGTMVSVTLDLERAS